MSSVGGKKFHWSKSIGLTSYGYGMKATNQSNVKFRFGPSKGWSHARMPMRSFRSEMFKQGEAMEGNIKKLMWGDFSNKLPVSVYYQPGSISSTSPNDSALITKPIAPEFAGSYQAQPWVAPDVFPDNHPLTRMPAPVRNVVAQAERKKNHWSSDEWYSMAEGEVLTPFEVLEVEVRRAGLWMKGGRHWRMMVTVIVSNGNGVAGLGIGEERNYEKSRNEAIKNAFGNLVAVDPSDHTVPHPIFFEFNRTKVQILPSKGNGSSGYISDLMSGIGLKGRVDIKKWTHRKYKKLMTMLAALRTMRSTKVIAQQRGLTVSTVRGPIFTYLESVRRKRGMFELSPEGRTGFLPPNRVIDNRMPDHLKAKYFSGTKDEHFGHVASSDTFRLDSGTERYGKRNTPYLNLESDQSDYISSFKEADGVQRNYVPKWTRGVQSRAREEWLAA
eukprot:TRINITY_DN33434_c0_g1_i1.p1 TRINITY_DN33434_c0_g1~~TRINITY_DN33434_c0_g1_i1.p1  ORF type:complete len:443 (+),score=154.59 TRINITY_DN33434_c0_g1_i1:79-1407(+)